MRIRLVVTLVAVLGIVAVTLPAIAQSLAGFPADVVPFKPSEIRTEQYAVVDSGAVDGPEDDRTGSATWRVVEGTGNC